MLSSLLKPLHGFSCCVRHTNTVLPASGQSLGLLLLLLPRQLVWDRVTERLTGKQQQGAVQKKHRSCNLLSPSNGFGHISLWHEKIPNTEHCFSFSKGHLSAPHTLQELQGTLCKGVRNRSLQPHTTKSSGCISSQSAPDPIRES